MKRFAGVGLIVLSVLMVGAADPSDDGGDAARAQAAKDKLAAKIAAKASADADQPATAADLEILRRQVVALTHQVSELQKQVTALQGAAKQAAAKAKVDDSAAAKPDEQKPVKGMTLAEATKLFGQPESTRGDSDGVETVIWEFYRPYVDPSGGTVLHDPSEVYAHIQAAALQPARHGETYRRIRAEFEEGKLSRFTDDHIGDQPQPDPPAKAPAKGARAKK